SVKTSDGYTVRGQFCAVRRPKGTVVLFHGLQVDRHEHLGFYDQLAGDLIGQEYSVVRFDFRGHGASSGGNRTYSGICQLIDTETVCRFVSTTTVLADAPLHLVGTSMGGVPALWAAAASAQRGRSAFLIAPVLDYRRTFLVPETDWAAASFTR